MKHNCHHTAEMPVGFELKNVCTWQASQPGYRVTILHQPGLAEAPRRWLGARKAEKEGRMEQRPKMLSQSMTLDHA